MGFKVIARDVLRTDFNVRNMRYITEDIPYGTALWSSLGNMIGVDMPVTDSIIELASTILGRDCFKSGRKLEKLGIAGMTVDALEKYLYGSAHL